MMMVVFSVIFGKIAKFPTGGIPYPVFVYAGLLCWKYFTTSLSDSVNSVVSASQMISKVYFPRLILPFSRVAASTVDFAIAFLVLVVLMAYYQIVPGWRLLLLPPLVLLTALAAVGLGAFLAALNVSFRDVRFVIPFIVQMGLFLTPAIYMDTTASESNDQTERVVARRAKSTDSADESKATSPRKKSSNQEDLVPDRLQRLLHLNPMMGIISSFRAAILNKPLPWGQLAYSSVATIVVFLFGCMYFERAQRSFADII
jgi:lipopolysaccharide transport system permease protein